MTAHLMRPRLLTPLLIVFMLPLYAISAFFLIADAPFLSVLVLAALLSVTTFALPALLRAYGWEQAAPGLAVVSDFFLFFLQSFFLLASLWHWVVEDVYFYCADRAPVLDFFPPFVHAPDVDYYIASEQFVYNLWYGFVGVIFVLPLVLTWLYWQRLKTKQGAMS